MPSNKLVKLLLFLVLTSTIASYGMSGDRESAGPGIPGRPHVPDLLPIIGEAHLDQETIQVLNKIAHECAQAPKNLEPQAKRRRTAKEEDISQQPRPREAPYSSTTTTTTTTSTESSGEGLRGSSWAESEWTDVLRAIDQRTAQEDAEEWFSGILPQIEDTLFRRDSNLVNSIAQRFFEREITLDELNAGIITRSPYTVRLWVAAEDDQQITGQHIEIIGRMFPNLRELDLGNTRTV